MKIEKNNPFVKVHQPCPCGKSSDAYAECADGSGWCFSCRTLFKGNSGELDVETFEKEDEGKKEAISNPSAGSTLQFFPLRSHSLRAEEFYSIKTRIEADGNPSQRIYTYPTGWDKVRNIANKTFFCRGETKPGLFGRNKFSAGASPVITIVEGEEDVLSVYEILNGKYPVVSVQSSSTAKRDCAADRDFLNQYSKIVLCFDNDESGNRAATSVASLFDFNKVYQCKLGRFKDANAYEIAGAQDEFRSLWYNSKRFLPEGIISSWSSFAEIIRQNPSESIGTYPFRQLQEMSYGIRPGETILIKAPEKVGKTEFIRTIEHHLLKTTDLNIGCIHIEETKNRQLRGLAGIELKVPCHLPDTPIAPEEIDRVLQQITKRDDRLHLYGHFGSDDPDLFLDRIRFLSSAAGCRVIFLDHISMVVSGLNLDDERKILDYLSTELATLCHNLGFCLIVISHVNDEGLTRGSRNIAKVADLILRLERDKEHPDPYIRNTTQLIVEGNRFAGQTGPAGAIEFDPISFCLREKEDEKELPPC